MVEVFVTYGVPDEIAPELKKKYAAENTDLRVTLPHPLTPPYYAFGDPRSKAEPFKFQGKEFWVYRTSPGVKMNWVYDHK